LTDSVSDLGAEVVTIPFLDRGAWGFKRLSLWGRRLTALVRSATSGRPFYMAKYTEAAVIEKARALVKNLDPDIVQVEYLQLAGILEALHRQRAAGSTTERPRLILDSHEFSSLPRRRRASRSGWVDRMRLLAEARSWDRLARDASRWADTTVCVTEQDEQQFAAIGARNLVTVPLGIDTRTIDGRRAPDPPRRVLFLGSFAHPPNRAAAALLCDTIWPAAVVDLPGWELVLAGPGSDAFLANHGTVSDSVRATGFVDDLDELFRQCRLFAAPLFEGGGIKIKVLEAMARGIPLVSTPVGAEGIATRSDEVMAWAETPGAFTAALVEAARNPRAAEALALRARRHVEDHFSWESVVERLETVYGASG